VRPHHARSAAALLLAAGFVLSGSAAFAGAIDVTLGFSSLPSAQGFTYTAVGAHAGVPEASIYSVSGGVLTMNSIGQSNGITGGSIFYVITGGITTTDTKQIQVTARCLETQGSTNDPNGYAGFFFGFTTGSVQYGFGLTPTKISVLGPSGVIGVTGTFDNTQFHHYVFDWTPPNTFAIYRDSVLIHTGTGGFGVAANRLFFGDGSGGANANGEIREYRFIQDLPTPVLTTSWGLMLNAH